LTQHLYFSLNMLNPVPSPEWTFISDLFHAQGKRAIQSKYPHPHVPGAALCRQRALTRPSGTLSLS
jgi:hypothetical protein